MTVPSRRRRHRGSTAVHSSQSSPDTPSGWLCSFSFSSPRGACASTDELSSDAFALPAESRYACAQLEQEQCQPRFHGPGAGRACALPAPSAAIARERKLRPDPIGSDTSCRELAATPAGEAGAAVTPLKGAPASSSPRRSAFANPRRRPAHAGPSRRAPQRACQPASRASWRARLGVWPLAQPRRRQGRLTRFPAKGIAIRCTRGAFHRWATPFAGELVRALLRCGVGSTPQVVPNLWTTGPAPFRSSSVLPPLTGWQGTMTRLPSRRPARGRSA